MLNTNYKEYAVHVYENNPFSDGFKREIDTLSTYPAATDCAKGNIEALNENEHIEIIEIEYDTDGNEVSRKFIKYWQN